MEKIKKYNEQLDVLQRHFNILLKKWNKVKHRKSFKKLIIKKCLVINMRLQAILLKRSFDLLFKIESS